MKEDEKRDEFEGRLMTAWLFVVLAGFFTLFVNLVSNSFYDLLISGNALKEWIIFLVSLGICVLLIIFFNWIFQNTERIQHLSLRQAIRACYADYFAKTDDDQNTKENDSK